jgi:predicted N-acyltransferase
MVLFIARDRGLPVAVAICFRSDEALYGRYWGCSGNYHSLHFELCFYQGIAYCLREGLRRFEPGAGGEHKLARGFTPTVVQSAHWIADPGDARASRPPPRAAGRCGRRLPRRGRCPSAFPA